jgi:hypothetical protein
MLTTQVGALNGCNLINNQFDTLWIPGEQEDLTDIYNETTNPTGDLKKLMTVTYIGANQFKIEGLDTTDIMQIGTKFRCKQGGDYLYLECTAISFSTDTIITTKGDTLANAVITDFYYSNSANPFGWPVEWSDSATTTGWMPLFASCDFVSADDPIFVLNITGDYTHLTPGNRFRCTQVTGGQKDFIIHAVGSFAAGVTPITIFGGTGANSTVLNDEAITNVYFSMMNFPSGFDTDPSRWQILILDSTDYTINNVTLDTWVNPGTLQIDVPVGLWSVGYDVQAYADPITTTTSGSLYATLSTSNNTESNPRHTSNFWIADLNAGDHLLQHSFSKSFFMSVEAKTKYYLNIKSLSGAHLSIKGTHAPTAIYARSYFF